MKAILFPGQGSQLVGMGSEFYNNFDSVKKIFLEADDKLSFKISKIILDGPEADLKLTQNTQPAILIVSYAIFTVLKKEFDYKLDDVKFFAGHSLGEYSALLCANALNFNDALNLVFQRGKSMQEAVPVGEGGMLAVLGCTADQVSSFISKIKFEGVCEIANDNAEGQVIISGDTKSIEELKTILKINKKKAINLTVSAKFHSSLMKSEANKMKIKINETEFKKPDFDIISNVTSLPANNPLVIKNLLFEQIYSKVRWRESILYMAQNKINQFIEIGPGKVLTGLSKRISPDTKSFCINTIDDIKNINNES